MLCWYGRAAWSQLVTGESTNVGLQHYARLYTNPAPDNLDNPSIGVDIIEATFTGYAPQLTANWHATLHVNGYGQFMTQADPVTFHNGGATDVTVYGMFLSYNLVDFQFVGYGAFPTPVVIPAGQDYIITPQMLTWTFRPNT